MPLISKLRNCLSISAAIAALVAPRPALAAETGCQASDAQLLAAMQSVHDKQKNVGVQAAIHRGGKLAFSDTLGLADRERKLPVTRDTVFPVASITKAFTGVATLKAEAAGRIGLDDPIQRYVPEFPVKPELVVTPRRLAAHRAGLRHWGPERDALFTRHFDRIHQIIPLFKDDPLLAKAGTDYQYSSYGYNLLALAIERATGVEFTRYVEREIIEPLGLSKIRFDDARAPAPGMASLYSFYDLKTYADIPDPVRVPVRDYSHNMGGGNMSATAEQLVAFGAALLQPGLLPPRQHELLFTQPAFGGEPSAMSFGFFVADPGAERRINISGANPGVQAGLFVYPERSLTVAVLANTWGVGSRDAEMTSELPKRLADLCAPPPAAKPEPAAAKQETK